MHVVEQLTARNIAILTAIEEQIGAMPPGLFHPLGEEFIVSVRLFDADSTSHCHCCLCANPWRWVSRPNGVTSTATVQAATEAKVSTFLIDP